VRHGQRWAAGLLSGCVLVSCVGLARGQVRDVRDPREILRRGQLVVWVVKASTAVPRDLHIPQYRTPTPGYTESTTGALGQTASSYGQTAGSYGTSTDSASIAVPTAEQLAAAEANGGLPAYNEQTSGSFGQTAGSVGTVASDHGQTAGSYGESLSTIAQAGNAPAIQAAKAAQGPSKFLLEMESRLGLGFTGVQVKYREVEPEKLGEKLKSAQADEFPDLLVGTLPAAWWNGLQRQYGLAMLRPAIRLADGVSNGTVFSPDVAILAHAPHKDVARAAVIWLSEGSGACAGCSESAVLEHATKEARIAAAKASTAMAQLLQGNGLGDLADPAIAEIAPRSVRAMLATTGNESIDGSATRVEVNGAEVVGRLAAVMLRVVGSTDRAFGVAHPLVVLRKEEDGSWRVLHVSLNQPAWQSRDVGGVLVQGCPEKMCEGGLLGISQAAPPDGDVRPLTPELWWDNGGGSRLQVVEWQFADASGWSDAHLYLVPDTGVRLQTRVTAGFASLGGKYRWRVWSVGAEGEMKISGWKTLVVVP